MKIAVSSQGPGLDSQIDPRFGRTAYLLIIDTATSGVEVLDNSEFFYFARILNYAHQIVDAIIN